MAYFSSTYGLENPVSKNKEVENIRLMQQRWEIQKQQAINSGIASPEDKLKAYFPEAIFETDEEVLLKHQAFIVLKVMPVESEEDIDDEPKPKALYQEDPNIANILSEQAEEIVHNNADPEAADEQKLIQPIPEIDISILKMRMTKSTLAHRFTKVSFQKQIHVCALSLLDHIRILLQYLSITEGDNNRVGKSNKYNRRLEQDNDPFSTLHDSCYQFLSKLTGVEDASRSDRSRLRDMSLIEAGIEKLNLHNTSEQQFDESRLEKIRQIKEALLNAINQAEEHKKNAANDGLQRIKEKMLAQTSELEDLDEDTFEKIRAVVGIGNVCKKIDRDFGSILQIQGLNSNTLEDERHLATEQENLPLKFESVLIRKIPKDQMQEMLDSIKMHVHNLDDSHRAVETHHQNLQKIGQQPATPSRNKAQLEKDTLAFNQLNLRMREFNSHLIKLIQTDPVGQKLTEAEENRLIQNSKESGIKEKVHQNMLKAKARLLAAVGLLDFGSTGERATDAKTMYAKIRAISLLKREADNIVSYIDELLSEHDLDQIDRESEDRKSTLEKIIKASPHVNIDKYWALALSEAVIIRNVLIKYESEQAAILAIQGANPIRIEDPNLRLPEYFVGLDEDLISQQASDKLSELSKQKNLFEILAFEKKVFEKSFTIHNKEENYPKLREIGQGMEVLQSQIIEIVAEHMKNISSYHKRKHETENLTQQEEELKDEKAIKFSSLPKEIQKLYLQERAAVEGRKLKNPPETVTDEELGTTIFLILKGRAQEKGKLIEKINKLKEKGENEPALRYQALFGLDLNGAGKGITKLLQDIRSNLQKQKNLVDVLEEIKEQKARINLILREYGLENLQLEDHSSEIAIRIQITEQNLTLATQPGKLHQLGLCYMMKMNLVHLEADIEQAFGMSCDNIREAFEKGLLPKALSLSPTKTNHYSEGILMSNRQRHEQDEEEQKYDIKHSEKPSYKESWSPKISTFDFHAEGQAKEKNKNQQNSYQPKESPSRQRLIFDPKVVGDQIRSQTSEYQLQNFILKMEEQHSQSVVSQSQQPSTGKNAKSGVELKESSEAQFHQQNIENGVSGAGSKSTNGRQREHYARVADVNNTLAQPKTQQYTAIATNLSDQQKDHIKVDINADGNEQANQTSNFRLNGALNLKSDF